MRITIFFICFILLFSCQKESFTTSAEARLAISADTVHFDTVFTSLGSITQSFKIFNHNEQGIRIESVVLKGGQASPFNINVNGMPGPQTGRLEIAAGDSAYVFVSVNINPSSASLPFVVQDSIEIIYNTNKVTVQLEAFGRNARFFRNRTVLQNEVWNKDLPYVILGPLEVAPGVRLTIEEGTKVFFHADAPLLVKGTLDVKGNKYDSTRVVFTGNRLDEPYRSFPASWPGIVFTKESKDNQVAFALIKNAYQAVSVLEPSASNNPKLMLRESIIDNAYDIGLLGVHSSIAAQNLLVSNCGKNVVLVGGGNYQLTHCTVASVSTRYLPHKEPVLFVGNAVSQNNMVVVNDLNAVFRNCIFWGDGGALDNEVVVAKTGTAPFQVQFDHVLWRVKTEPANASVTSAINASPEFELLDIEKNQYDFHLKETSPALNKGINAGVNTDLDGRPRPVGMPDLGCFEKQ